MEKFTITIQDSLIEKKIYLIRGQRVMLDRDLAELYGVETKAFNQSVKRNLTRFPNDFRFKLNEKEWHHLKSQIVTSNWGGTRYPPAVFTEQGVAMLSSVLHSAKAIELNIRIIRIFTKLREFLSKNQDVLLKLEKLEKHLITHGNYIKKHDGEIEAIFELIDELRSAKDMSKLPPPNPIGFKINSTKK